MSIASPAPTTRERLRPSPGSLAEQRLLLDGVSWIQSL